MKLRDILVSVGAVLLCALLVMLQGCGGGDCHEDDPRCVTNDTPAPKPPCTNPKGCT